MYRARDSVTSLLYRVNKEGVTFLIAPTLMKRGIGIIGKERSFLYTVIFTKRIEVITKRLT